MNKQHSEGNMRYQSLAKRLLCLSLLGLGACGTAIASTPGFYFGAALDSATPNATYDNSTTSYSGDSKGIGGGLNIGYNFSSYFAIELGAHYFGNTSLTNNTSGTSDTISRSQWFPYLALRPMYPWTKTFNTFLQVGGGYDYATQDFSATPADDDKTTIGRAAPFFGAGIGYNISQAFEVDLSYNQIINSEYGNTNYVMLNFTYHNVYHFDDSGFITD
jgi:OOP family OmpA-OmpF porin